VGWSSKEAACAECRLQPPDKGQITVRAPLDSRGSGIHFFKPRIISHGHIAAPVKFLLCLPLTTSMGAGLIQGWHDLVCDPGTNIRDIQERVCERRVGKSVVLREWSGIEVKTQLTIMRLETDARLVYRKGNGKDLKKMINPRRSISIYQALTCPPNSETKELFEEYGILTNYRGLQRRGLLRSVILTVKCCFTLGGQSQTVHTS
jgi:hypothetical protein